MPIICEKTVFFWPFKNEILRNIVKKKAQNHAKNTTYAVCSGCTMSGEIKNSTRLDVDYGLTCSETYLHYADSYHTQIKENE